MKQHHESERRWGGPLRIILLVAVTAAIVAPATAWASHQFNDVPASNIFHADIDWMADNGVTKGCNPPANDEYCPDEFVTRGAMAAFMHRLETEDVFMPADGTAADADALGGVAAGQHLHSDIGALGFAWGCDADAGAPYDPTSKPECQFQGDYAHNSAGGDITIERLGTGDYLITFEGLAAASTGGTVSVTPFDPGVCVIDTWNHSGGDVTINLECFDFSGADTDLRWTVQYIA